MEVPHRAFHRLCRQKTTSQKPFHDLCLVKFRELNTLQFHKYFLHQYVLLCFPLKDQNPRFWHSHHDLQEHFQVLNLYIKYLMNEDEKEQEECLMHKILQLLLWIYLSKINKRKAHLLDSTLKQKRVLNHFRKRNPFWQSLDGWHFQVFFSLSWYVPPNFFW